MDLKLLGEQAVALHQQGREREAESRYLQILDAEPEDFTACYMLGAIRFGQGRGQEALPLFQTALKANPNATGPLMSTAVRNVPLPKQTSAGDDPGVDTLIASIIADNAGPHAQEPAKLSRGKAHAGQSAPMMAARP